MKDHKENFDNNPKCRLINPAKSEIGVISKYHLENINKIIREKTNVNQWRNTASVIKWFNAINNKQNSMFTKFDIVDFYPSISEDLLNKAIEFARTITTIDADIIQTISHARKALLFDSKNVWVKKDNPHFDVTMGSYDGAEVCELVGLYLLDILKNEFGVEKIGLYRDDGLGCFQNISGPGSERIKKKICKIFRENGLSITIETKLTITDYLDVTFNLKTGKYYPYRKENNVLQYIHTQSNHPPSIIKQIPSMISVRVSEISCDKEQFDKAAPDYNVALEKSGFKVKIAFSPKKPTKRNRKRRTIWFNPPYSANVKTNIGKLFLRLLVNNFPRHHRYHKLFNKNNVKLSYSCMPSMENIISNHNANLLKVPTPTAIKTCDCNVKRNCPLNGNCMSECVVYNANVHGPTKTRTYHGVVGGMFKSRYHVHNTSFRHRKYENDTELAKYVWKLHDKSDPYNISWSVATKAHPYVCGSRKCDLCLSEKVLIAQGDPEVMLNKRDELISKCRHRNKYTLANYKNK